MFLRQSGRGKDGSAVLAGRDSVPPLLRFKHPAQGMRTCRASQQRACPKAFPRVIADVQPCCCCHSHCSCRTRIEADILLQLNVPARRL